MAFKDILVQLDNHRNYDSRLRIALSIAQRSEARLAALYGFELPQTPALSPSLAEALYVPNAAAQATYERERDGAFADAEQLEATFHAAIRRAGVRGSWETWPEKPKSFTELITSRARYADLAVLGQADPDHPAFDAVARLPETVMLDCGRPVLIVPYATQASFVGENVLVAWNGTREAARAVGDAMPILRSAATVTVLSLGNVDDGEGSNDQPAHHLVEHLSQHGVRAEASHLGSDDIAAGELLLSQAVDLGSDLIVMGGYGHSRTRELILGGVTRTVLQHMPVPVLMSH